MVENEKYPTTTLEADNVGSYIYVDDNFEAGIAIFKFFCLQSFSAFE